MTKLQKRTLSGSTLLVLAVLLVALVVLSNTLLRGARIDLTENRLYTLSPGTVNILRSIDEPIQLTFYYSERASRDLPQIRTYAQRVRELLEEMAQVSRGGIRLTVVDPLPFSEDEDRANAAGLQALPIGSAGESLFLGLVGSNAINTRAVIPFFRPEKEVFLEYDLAKLVHELLTPDRPVVGVISSLPIGAGFDPLARRSGEPWVIASELESLFEVRALNTAVTRIDDDIELLMLVHPKELSTELVYAIDQFVLGGGRLLLFLDPHADLDPGASDVESPTAAMFASRASDIPRLLSGWGLRYDPSQVVLDRQNAMTVGLQTGQTVRHPAILGLGPAFLNADDIISGQLSAINLATAGHIALAEDAQIQLVPLLQSSGDAMVVDSERIRFLGNPAELFQGFSPSGERYVLAARLVGELDSAFPDRADREGHRARSDGPVNVVIVADTDLLADRMWVEVRNFLGQRIFNVFANNGDFVTNAVDNLLGSSDLISVRGRATSARPFERVEALRRAADERFRSTEQRLQEELRETERRLTELQQGRGAEAGFILSPEQRAEIERFRAEQLRIRQELRSVRRELDADIERLGTRLKLLNIALMPLLLTGAAAGYVYWRARRRRLAAEGAHA